MFFSGSLFNSFCDVKKTKFAFIIFNGLKKKNFNGFLCVYTTTKKCVFVDYYIAYMFVFCFSKTFFIKFFKNTTTPSNYVKTGLTKLHYSNYNNVTKNLIKYSKLLTIRLNKGYLFSFLPKYHTSVDCKSILNTPKNINSSIYKNICLFDSQSAEFQFLRKNKVYNKGRYSRCRQNYRTGVYLCMYLSIVSIFGLYYWFFKFSFNFSYL